LEFNAKWTIFQQYRGKNKLHFHKMMMMSTERRWCIRPSQ